MTTLEKLSNIEPVKARFVLQGWIPLPIGAVTMLNSDGGIGKTRLSLLIADKLSTLERKKSLLWLTEDYPGQVRYTFNELIINNMAKEENLENIYVEKRKTIFDENNQPNFFDEKDWRFYFWIGEHFLCRNDVYLLKSVDIENGFCDLQNYGETNEILNNVSIKEIERIL